VNAASLESVAGANLLNDLGFTDVLGLTTNYGLPATGIPSDALNVAHHMTHDPIVIGKRSYVYMGGLISANVFRCDVADPLHIPTCPLFVSPKDVKNFSGVDDFLQAPSGNVLITYMGAKTLRHQAAWSKSASMALSWENTQLPRSADRRATCRASTRSRIPGCWPIHTGLMPAGTWICW
jgi:hypothetical protein